MKKIKYYQLAINEAGHSMLLVSPNQKIIDKAVTDGYTVFGYNNKEDIPANPILDNGEVREMTEFEIEASAVAEEATRQAAKPDKLKQAENAFFTLIAMLNDAESLGITHADNPDAILAKGAALSMTKKAYYGTLLQNAVHEIEINGGSWEDLPNQAHNLEE